MIAVTMGDANGVGPEILLRTLHEGGLPEDVVVYGDRTALEQTARGLGLDVLFADADASSTPRGCLRLHDLRLLRAADIQPGTISSRVGAAAVACVDAATRAALEGRVDAVVTLPIHKEAAARSIPEFQGHTERIADLCGTPRDSVTMMLAAPDLIVTHVSTHVSLREAVDRVQRDRIESVIALTHDATARLRMKRKPSIAVAGLNPHAGEHGRFGHEEQSAIAPAVEDARRAGINASGPHSPDTLFKAAIEGRYDAVVCMYHDQGHIPMKLHGFAEAVNVTLGLPILRTSVDHGTAFDIAGQGVADIGNFKRALEMALRLRQGT